MRIESVPYWDEDTKCEAYIAHPAEGDAPKPAVLIAHQWSGPSRHEQDSAARLAALGYVGIAIDVFGDGQRGDAAGDNSALIAPFMQDRMKLRRRLLAAVTFARSHAAVDPHRMAVIGYCFGGLCALDVARSGTREVRGVVSLHGMLMPPPSTEPIHAKMLLLHGWADPLAPPSAVVAAAEEFTGAGADWQLHGYGHAMHAFTMPKAAKPERGLQYDASADHRSWAALTGFLQEIFV